MAKRAEKPELATEAEDNGASTDETSAIEDGKILDYRRPPRRIPGRSMPLCRS